jgi:hypothetical protein
VIGGLTAELHISLIYILVSGWRLNYLLAAALSFTHCDAQLVFELPIRIQRLESSREELRLFFPGL